MTDAEPRILPGGRRPDTSLPLVTVDMDGVLCQPLFGWNATAHGPVAAPESVPPLGRRQRWLWLTETVRYLGRRRMPGADGFLRALAPHYRLILVTARGQPWAHRAEGWLERNRMWESLAGLVFREGPEQPPYAFKAAVVGALAPAWHVDDDGRTALEVWRKASRPVILIAWPQNAGLYPSGVIRVEGLAGAARYLLREAGAVSQSSSSPGRAEPTNSS
jgi:hypothetical protein